MFWRQRRRKNLHKRDQVTRMTVQDWCALSKDERSDLVRRAQCDLLGLFEIGGGARVFLVRRGSAADYVDVPHNAAPVRLRFRFAQATPDTASLKLRMMRHA
jgi:hypothetical protein